MTALTISCCRWSEGKVLIKIPSYGLVLGVGQRSNVYAHGGYEKSRPRGRQLDFGEADNPFNNLNIPRIHEHSDYCK